MSWRQDKWAQGLDKMVTIDIDRLRKLMALANDNAPTGATKNWLAILDELIQLRADTASLRAELDAVKREREEERAWKERYQSLARRRNEQIDELAELQVRDLIAGTRHENNVLKQILDVNERVMRLVQWDEGREAY